MVALGFVAGGQIAVDLLWDDRYAGAGWALRLLSLGAWFSFMEMTNGSSFLARGKANMLALANGAKLAGMVFLIPLGFRYGGFPGAVTAYAGTELFKYAVSATTMAQAGLSNWRRDIGLTLQFALAALVGSLAGQSVRTLSGSVLLGAITVFVVVTAAWSPLGLMWKRSLAAKGQSFFGD